MLLGSPRTFTHGDARVVVRGAPWDERSLGVGVAELLAVEGAAPPALDAVLAEVDDACRDAGVGLVTTRVLASATVALSALERADYRGVETSHPLRLSPLPPPPPRHRRLALEAATPGDAPALAALARTAFAHSRYHEDPRIHPGRARARMAAWIVDSLHNGDEVVVARRDGALAAMLSWRCEGDVARLLLGATTSDAGPLGPLLWSTAIGILAERGVGSIDTRVSAANLAALRLHAALGFVAGPAERGLTKLYPGGAEVVGAPPPVERTT